ncbi:SEC-C domain-containing protein [Pseudonocardia sp. RS11V-5]|uniref:SEC-C metal-binding domain-containing protein n=1 Tax=Pseudonocardia terrae TaxID=2905831 RepID=UPI001E3CB061|nr:SEC-C metal-binding domain-containing protein [Pseudonocardia terrae]MCE3550178.1 SEC-C domain-containing protein [Pseudonocardia terrae]
MTDPAADVARKEAEELEAQVAEYPDDRAEILREAAYAWLDAGEVARAEQILRELVTEGGEDGCWARTDLIEVLYTDGREKTAEAELDALARHPELDRGHCAVTAERLAERGFLTRALAWYDRFVARLSSDDLDALRGPKGWMSLEAPTLRGRRQVREELGLPPDATDELVPGPPTVEDLARLRKKMERFASSRAMPTQVRVVVFTRPERREACRMWPATYTADDDYFDAVERHWREIAESGGSSIRLYPITARGLARFAETEGLDPEQEETRTRYLDTLSDDDAVAWPPGRNAPCWCASGRKYKKCCGAVR